MDKFIAILQLIASGLLAVIVLFTAVNLVLISNRPETISVVNALIGQGVVIICLSVLMRILFRKGMTRLRGSKPGGEETQ